jgi:hypothetical protein
MRLWSLHPKHLDRQGLIALWREALLAQAVLQGRTRGYRAHPQLTRFRKAPAPRGLIAAYLHAVWAEARRRGYRFDRSRIAARPGRARMVVARGQLDWEWQHLGRKLRIRSPGLYVKWRRSTGRPLAHPLFRVVRGDRADWERG